MSAQPQHTEWDQLPERDLILARLHAAVDAALPLPVERPLRARLADGCRTSPRVTACRLRGL